jgi:hypothetical protein
MVLLRALNYDFSAQEVSDITTDVKAGVITISVLNSTGFSVNDYLIIEPYTERAEIVQIASKAGNTGLTLASVCKFSHRTAARLFRVPFNQVRYYSASIVSGPYTLIVAADTEMDYSDIFTVYSYSAGTSAMFFKRTFYNSTSLVESDIAVSDYWQTSDEELIITPQELRVYMQFDKNDYPNEADMRTIIRMAQDQLTLDAATTDQRILRIGLFMLSKWYVLRGLATRSISKGYITINAEGRVITKAYQEFVLEAENTIEEYKGFLISNLRHETSSTNFMTKGDIDAETRQNIIDRMQGTSNARLEQRNYAYGVRRTRY